MGWTSKMRSNKFSWYFDSDGRHRGNTYNSLVETQTKRTPSVDTENRNAILKEIEKRVLEGENLDSVVEEIANRAETKKQFHYYAKNGITDLAPIFKNWYEAHKRNREKNAELNKTRW